MGLILAVPLAGATKIVCDYVDPLRGFGAWLGVFRVSFKEKSLALQFDLPCTPT